MKNLIRNTFLVLLMSVFSCSGILDEVPKDFISSANFYQNEADAEAAIAAAYGVLNSDQYGITWYLMMTIHADYVNGRGSQQPIGVYNELLNSQNIGRCASIWTELYEGINRANAVLDNVPGITDISEPVKERILAEAHFLRAFHYYNLVRAFGPVPLRLNESTDLSGLAVARQSEEIIYDFIIEETLIAEAVLPGGYPNPTSQTARASVWAAKMLLASVYLTLEQWDLARDKAEEVINGGAFSLVEVSTSDDFYNIFGEELDSNPEDIMCVNNTDFFRSQIPQYTQRAGTPYNNGGFYAWLPEMNSFLGSWDTNDLRRDFNIYTEYVNSNGDTVQLPSSSPVLFKKFTNKSGLANVNIPIFRYTEAYLIYAEAASQANSGPTAQALEYLNTIRRRAYGFDPYTISAVDYPAGMTAQQFQDTVLQERAYEFVLEGRRWWDLKRTGKAKEVIESVHGAPFLEERLLWPIAEDEINNNPLINQEDQNPGY